MKKFKILVWIGVAVFAVVQPLSAIGKDNDPGKYKDLFVFKTSREFVGAKVEVIYSSGEVITTQRVKKRKMIIDFSDVEHGNYTIRISKGDKVKEIHYEKE